MADTESLSDMATRTKGGRVLQRVNSLFCFALLVHGNYAFVVFNISLFVNFSPPWRKEGERDILPVAMDGAAIHPSNPADPKHSLVQVPPSLSEALPLEMMPKTQVSERLRKTQSLQSDWSPALALICG